MQLSIEFLTSDAVVIEVYQATLGNVDELLATFYSQAKPEGDVNQATKTTSSQPVSISKFNICLPAGTYSVVFVVRAASPNGRPLFNIRSFLYGDSSVCSNSVESNLTGKTNPYLNAEKIVSRS
jgi:hypothetical protein